MSARNLVRSLRDGGALDGRPPRSSWVSGALIFLLALGLGAFAYLGVVYALPYAAHLLEKPPVKVNYARPD